MKTTEKGQTVIQIASRMTEDQLSRVRMRKILNLVREAKDDADHIEKELRSVGEALRGIQLRYC